MSEPVYEAQLVSESSWTRRRRMMFAVVGFCMGSIAYVLYTGSDTEVARTTVTMAFTTLISVTGTYVFGATWDDKR